MPRKPPTPPGLSGTGKRRTAREAPLLTGDEDTSTNIFVPPRATDFPQPSQPTQPSRIRPDSFVDDVEVTQVVHDLTSEVESAAPSDPPAAGPASRRGPSSVRTPSSSRIPISVGTPVSSQAPAAIRASVVASAAPAPPSKRGRALPPIKPPLAGSGSSPAIARGGAGAGSPDAMIRDLERRAERAAAADSAEAVSLFRRAAELTESKVGDARRAIAAYRRVYEIDDANVPALEALDRLSVQIGDWEASAAYKGRLAGLASDPVVASRIHTEVGDLLSEDHRDAKGARLQYERATSLDPSNVAAWKALTREADRDGDDERRCRILLKRAGTLDDNREAGQLYAEAGKGWADLGQMELAFEAYKNAVNADPSHEPAATALLSDHVANSRWRAAEPLVDLLLPLAKKRVDTPRILQLVRLGGRVARALGNKPRAVEAALTLYESRGQSASVREELLEAVYLAKDDVALVTKARTALVQIQSATDLPLTALLTLAELRGVLREWRPMAELLGRALKLDQQPAQRTQVLLARARVLEEHLGDLAGALEVYEAALTASPSDAEALAAVERICAARSDRRTVERILRKVLENLPDSERDARHLLMQRLGEMYKSEGQGMQAMDMFRAASRLEPSNGADREAIRDLYLVTAQLDAQIERTMAKVAKEPLVSRGYGELYTLFLRQNAFDKAWCALDVLSDLGRLDEEERRFYDDYPPLALKDVPGQLTISAWRSHLVPPGLSPQLTSVLYPIACGYLRSQVAHIEPAHQLASLGQPFTRDISRGAGEVVTLLRNSAEILALSRPAAFVRRGVDEAISLVHAPGNAFYICPDAVEAVPIGELPFVFGQKLAEGRPELMVRALFPTTALLKNALGCAIATSRGAPFPAARNLLNVAAHMSRDEHDALRQSVGEDARDAARLDLARWAQLVDDATARAGLLLCGRVSLARRALEKARREPDDASKAPLADRVASLYLFAVGDTYSDLRGALGVGVNVPS